MERDPVGEVGQGVVVGDVPELALSVGQRLGGLLALGDVDDDPVDEEAPVLGAPRVHAVPHPARASVVADEAVLDLERLAALDRVVCGVVGGLVVGVHGVLPGLLGSPVVREAARAGSPGPRR